MASFDQKLRTLRLMEILLDRTDDTPVSYTHLTLPTSARV